MVERRRAKCSVDTVELLNEQDEQGRWVPRKYSVLDWVMLRPSSRGRFRVKKKDIQNLSKHWKATIKAFRIHPHGSSTMQALVQHVYMHKELALGHEQAIGHKPNSKPKSIFLYIILSCTFYLQSFDLCFECLCSYLSIHI